jgi:hypothetical protein
VHAYVEVSACRNLRASASELCLIVFCLCDTITARKKASRRMTSCGVSVVHLVNSAPPLWICHGHPLPQAYQWRTTSWCVTAKPAEGWVWPITDRALTTLLGSSGAPVCGAPLCCPKFHRTTHRTTHALHVPTAHGPYPTHRTKEHATPHPPHQPDSTRHVPTQTPHCAAHKHTFSSSPLLATLRRRAPLGFAAATISDQHPPSRPSRRSPHNAPCSLLPPVRQLSSTMSISSLLPASLTHASTITRGGDRAPHEQEQIESPTPPSPTRVAAELDRCASTGIRATLPTSSTRLTCS